MPRGSTSRTRAFNVTVLLGAIVVGLLPSAAMPAYAKDPPPPPRAVADDLARQREVAVRQSAADEQRRRGELERSERSRQAADAWREAQRQSELSRREAARTIGQQNKAVVPAARPGLSIGGRITGEGTAVADGDVFAYEVTTGLAGQAETSRGGEFRIVLGPGTYKFLFRSRSGPWVPEWWNDRQSYSEATAVVLGARGAPPRLNADLERGVFVTGHVTDSLGGAGVADVGVIAQPFCCESFGSSTDGDGRYRMVVRKGISVKVAFFPPNGSIPYVAQYWNARPTFDEADLLAVGTTDIPNIDAVLERGVFVRGRITDAETGLPLRGSVSALAMNVACCQNFSAVADDQGNYAMAVRKNISIAVGFSAPVGPVAYVPLYWNGKRSIGEADLIAVGGVDISDINGALEHGVWLRGRVTDAETLQPIAFTTVTAQTVVCCEGLYAFTAVDGTYSVAVRKHTDVRVGFFPPQNGQIPYLSEWYRDHAAFGDADVVPVATADVTGIDASIDRGVFVRGHVSDAETGLPVPQTSVSASLASGVCCEGFFGSTDARGDYAMAVRKNLTLKVLFTPQFIGTVAYVDQWYSGKSTFEAADLVSVGTSNVDHIDAALGRGAFLRGRVTDAISGGGIAGVGVNLQLTTGACCGFFASTDSRGDYRTVVPRNVSLKVGFFPPSGAVPYLGQWYRAKASFFEADVVEVGTSDVAGIDAALESGVFVRGRVIDAVALTGIPFAFVSAQRVDGACCESFSASTDGSGDYVMVVRKNVRLKVAFFPPFNSSTPYVGEWWDHKTSFFAADELAVGSTDVPNINGALARGVFVRGHVTEAATNASLAGVSVNGFVESDVCCESYFAVTDGAGDYALAARQNVSLRISFLLFGSELLEEFYNDKPSFFDADLVPVGTTEVTGIDAALERGVRVAGRVTDPDGIGASNVSVNLQTALCCAGVAYTQTDFNGDYALFARPGDYKVSFFPQPPSDLLEEWWDDQPTFDSATVLTVVAGTPRTNISASLARGVRVSGRVTDGTGTGVPNVGVNANLVDPGPCCVGFFAQTAGDGSYSMAVRAGSYKFGFFPQPGSGFLSEYYNNKPNFGLADVVPVGPGPATVDAVLALGVGVSGRVTDAVSNVGLGNVQVDLFALDGSGNWFGFTDAQGFYTATVPQNVTIKVAFTAFTAVPYHRQWYDRVSEERDAARIPVGTAEVPDINAAMILVGAPTLVDARITADGPGSSDFVGLSDAFSVTFSEGMNGAATGTISIQDQDGTTATIQCSAVAGPEQAICTWDVTVTVLSVALTGTLTWVDGTTPGMQVPFDITRFSGVTDLSANPPVILDLPDRLVDHEDD